MVFVRKIYKYHNENSNSLTAEDCFVYLAESRKKLFAISGVTRESYPINRRVYFH